VHARSAEAFITYPDAGQFYGRRAYVQGFVEPWNNGSGQVRITVGGQVSLQTGGDIGISVSKDTAA